jgi:hypothetical protein
LTVEHPLSPIGGEGQGEGDALIRGAEWGLVLDADCGAGIDRINRIYRIEWE